VGEASVSIARGAAWVFGVDIMLVPSVFTLVMAKKLLSKLTKAGPRAWHCITSDAHDGVGFSVLL
jgi:hypothetical protein